MSTATSKKPLPKAPPVSAAALKKTEPGNFGGPWRVITTVVLIFFASQFLAAIVAGIYLNIAGGAQTVDNSPVAEFLLLLVAEGLAAGFALLALKERGLSLKAIGLGRRPQVRDAVQAIIMAVVFYGVLALVSLVIDAFAPSVNKEQQDVGFSNLTTVSDNILAVIALVVLPPFGEEILVRGYLYSGLRSKMKYLPALLITSLIFGAAHLGESDHGLLWSGAIDTFLLSAGLVYLREHTGALYAGILLHMVNNILAFSVHFH